jgi:hypothetical protein
MGNSLNPLEKLDAAINYLKKAAQVKSNDEREELNRALDLIIEARGTLEKYPKPDPEKRVIFLTRLLELVKATVEIFLRCKLSLQKCRIYIWSVWNECREKYQINPRKSGFETEKIG